MATQLCAVVGGRLLVVCRDGWLVGWLIGGGPGVMSVAIAPLGLSQKRAGLPLPAEPIGCTPTQLAPWPNLRKHSASQSQPNPDKPSLNPEPSERSRVQPSPPHSTQPQPDM